MFVAKNYLPPVFSIKLFIKTKISSFSAIKLIHEMLVSKYFTSNIYLAHFVQTRIKIILAKFM